MGDKTYSRRLTLYPLHLLENLKERIRPLLQPVENPIILLAIKLITLLTLLGRVNHELHNALTDNRGTELNANELVHLIRNLLIESTKLKVPATMSAFANHALGYTVQRSEFDVVVFARGLFLQVPECFFEGDEFSEEDVGLVDFVGHDDEFLLRGEFQNGFDVVC